MFKRLSEFLILLLFAVFTTGLWLYTVKPEVFEKIASQVGYKFQKDVEFFSEKEVLTGKIVKQKNVEMIGKDGKPQKIDIFFTSEDFLKVFWNKAFEVAQFSVKCRAAYKVGGIIVIDVVPSDEMKPRDLVRFYHTVISDAKMNFNDVVGLKVVLKGTSFEDWDGFLDIGRVWKVK